MLCLTCDHWPVDGIGCPSLGGSPVGSCRRYCAMGVWCHPWSVCDDWTPRKTEAERATDEGRLF